MSSAYIVVVTGGDLVERKLVDQPSWGWIWGANKFTDTMVQDFLIYNRENISLTEAHDLFHRNSQKGQAFQDARSLLVSPSLFKNNFRCGGPGITHAEMQKFISRHRLWQWNEHTVRT
jgi:hypothetical protein